MIEDTKIGENDKAFFWTNAFCVDWDDGFRMIIGEEKKTGRKEYLLLENGEAIGHNTNCEAIYYLHDALVRAKLP